MDNMRSKLPQDKQKTKRFIPLPRGRQFPPRAPPKSPQSPSPFALIPKPPVTRMRRCQRHHETSQSSTQMLRQQLPCRHVSLKTLFRMSELSSPATCRPEIDPPRSALSLSLQNTTQSLQFQTHTLQLHCPSLFN